MNEQTADPGQPGDDGRQPGEQLRGAQRWQLSQPAESLAALLPATRSEDDRDVDCDLLIVGSGYGGAVAAARLAGATLDGEPGRPRPAARIWMLERGLERAPGGFASRQGELPGEVRFSLQDGQIAKGHASGLFDLRIGDDVHALVGNGLGGGSLINAGVMERPLAEVFASGWPAGIKLDTLAPSYDKAEQMLQCKPLPDGLSFKKLRALEATAAGGQTDCTRARVAVSFDAGRTPAGVPMAACSHCGDCITGCNQGAKNTLDTNYLAWAQRRGVRMFCGGWVAKLKFNEGATLWEIEWHYTAKEKRQRGAKPPPLRARNVLLAAGCLGSTEILLRSESERQRFSPQLGRRFSTNGDLIVAGYRQKDEVNACAEEDVEPGPEPGRGVGPTVSGLLRVTLPGQRLQIAVQEFAIPAPLRRLLGEVTTTFGTLHGLFSSRAAHPVDVAGGEDDLAVSTASLQYTTIYGLMGDDGAAGCIELGPVAAGTDPVDAAVRIRWDGKDKRLWTLFEQQTDWLKAACEADGGPGGTVVPNPTWQPLPGLVTAALGSQRGTALTVHPLGGCAMADNVDLGVVDCDGRVFRHDGTLHKGLAVLDGAIVPRALAINPALTIAALAERAIPGLAAHFGLALADAQAAAEPPQAQALRWLPRREVAPAATAIRIREQMRGRLELPGGAVWAELEIWFAEIPDLQALLRRAERRVDIGQAWLRLYPLAEFDPATDMHRQEPLAELAVSGGLRLLVPAQEDQQSGFDTSNAVLRSLLANIPLSALFEFLPKQDQVDCKPEPEVDPNLQALLGFVEAATVFRRQLVYALKIDSEPGANALGLVKGDELVGTKTMGFAKQGNPWRQLSSMQMVLVRQAATLPLGVLRADLDYFARYRELLLSVTAQRDQIGALADLAALALLVLRVVAAGQLLKLMPPGDTAPHDGERFPGDVDGRPPTVYTLDPDCRLSRYQPLRRAAAARPLLLIHGLSASGSTFTHPSIPGNLASFMLAQGRDVWVLDLRSSAAHVHRPGPFSFEQVAMGDIPRAVDRILELSDQQKLDVLAHCVGSAMFCMAVLGHPTLHRSIGHAVLSGVGPVVRMSPLNRLRGFVASLTEHYLANQEFDVRPGARAGLGLKLMDALLATLPYPEDDNEAMRAAALDDDSGRSKRDFRTVRHRADAIVGHSFEIDNLADDTLLALDAIFGWVKTRTLAQVQHLARQGVLTNAEGVNTDVADSTLRQRFGFPVLLLHGRRNRVFDWRGGRASYRLLKRVFNEAAGSNSAVNGDLHWGADSPRQLYVLQRYGHQDPLIGRHASFDVFPVVERFLASSERVPAPVVATRDRYFCETPWIGPTLGWMRALADTPEPRIQVALQVHPGPRNASTLCVVLAPAVWHDGQLPGWSVQVDRARGFRVDSATGRPQRELLLHGVLDLVLRRDGLPPRCAFAVLTLHCDALDAEDELAFVDGQAAAAGTALLGGLGLAPDALLAVSRFFDRVQERARKHPQEKPLERLLVHFDASSLAACDRAALPAASSPAQPLRFVAGSCQYPQGLFDRRVAQAAYRALLQRLLDDPEAAPAFLLLLGDQVYLDAVAVAFGLPVIAPRELARQGYELAWRLPCFRAVAARLPVYTMLDDHEIANDWQPPASESELSADEQVRLLAYRCYQAKLNPVPLGHSRSFSYRFAPGGHPFIVLDTRSQRRPRHIDADASWRAATIVAEPDMRALLAWLREHAAAPVKFIVSPSVVLPVPAGFDAGAPRLDFDGWAGYPASLDRLLRVIRDERIAGVVFIGGDEHLSLSGRLRLDNGVEVIAVVASGLHAPFPFVNTRRESLLLDGVLQLGSGDQAFSATMTAGEVLAGANHVLISVLPAQDGDPLRLRVELCPAQGQVLVSDYPLAGPPGADEVDGADGDRRQDIAAATTPAAAALAGQGVGSKPMEYNT